jgi:hypothetical protein
MKDPSVDEYENENDDDFLPFKLSPPLHLATSRPYFCLRER